MRAVLQRVRSASVSVYGKEISSIGEGLLVFLGIHRDDTDADIEYMAWKILGLRIFHDDAGTMNLSVEDVNGEILVVSQFTLYGDTRKGKRPSYGTAMVPEKAKDFYNRFLGRLKNLHGKIEAGQFGAMMQVNLVNSGPVTIIIDSARDF